MAFFMIVGMAHLSAVNIMMIDDQKEKTCPPDSLAGVEILK